MTETRIAKLPLGTGWLGVVALPQRTGKNESDLMAAVVCWRHRPISNTDGSSRDVEGRWPVVAVAALRLLRNGGRVLALGVRGRGRSVMALLRLMVDAGADAVLGLQRLPPVRPCIAEALTQQHWATTGAPRQMSRHG